MNGSILTTAAFSAFISSGAQIKIFFPFSLQGESKVHQGHMPLVILRWLCLFLTMNLKWKDFLFVLHQIGSVHVIFLQTHSAPIPLFFTTNYWSVRDMCISINIKICGRDYYTNKPAIISNLAYKNIRALYRIKY